VLLREGEYSPADLVLLQSSKENGDCFIQTSTLDGERALKHKQSLDLITEAINKKAGGLPNFKAFIHCEPPNKNLYEFFGYLESESLTNEQKLVTLDTKQVILRGSNVANTEWIIGAVVYTGKNTKLVMNQGGYRSKTSKLERLVNSIVIYLIGI